MADFRYDSCIRGFHVYKDVWNPVVGETLNAEREKKLDNPADKYAVSVMKDGNIVGHVPRKNSGFLSEALGNIPMYCDRKTSMVREFGHG
jgi:hypothetical protein